MNEAIAPRLAEDWVLGVSLRLEEDGPEVLREPVTPADLVGPRSETWLSGSLRAGRPGVRLSDLETRVVPIARAKRAGYSGYAIEAEDPHGHVSRSRFSVHSLGPVASRAARRLVREGKLKADDLYYYEIVARPRDGSEPAAAAEDHDDAAAVHTAPFSLQRTAETVDVLPVPLTPLLEGSRAVGVPGGAAVHPVLFTEDAIARAERVSRRGASRQPPEETGGVLVGTLASCPESGEFFVVIDDVLEAQDAEQSKFSLYYSGRTWSRIQTVVTAMRARPETRTWRIVGQAHGHNFLPADGAPPCERCATAEVCGRTTVFVSSDDVGWNRAVFTGQPWGLCHIFGLNARREEVQGLFGQRDGRLLERGYHVIPAFDPAEWSS